MHYPVIVGIPQARYTTVSKYARLNDKLCFCKEQSSLELPSGAYNELVRYPDNEVDSDGAS